MSNKKYFPILIGEMILLGLAIYANARILFSSSDAINWGYRLGEVVTLCAVLNAFVYLIDGCKKDAARFFRDYVISLTVAELYSMVLMAKGNVVNVAEILPAMVSFGLLCILSVAENFGRRNTNILAGIILVCKIISAISVFLQNPGLRRGGTELGTVCLIRSLTSVALVLIMCFMIYAKYEDKASRGSK